MVELIFMALVLALAFLPITFVASVRNYPLYYNLVLSGGGGGPS